MRGIPTVLRNHSATLEYNRKRLFIFGRSVANHLRFGGNAIKQIELSSGSDPLQKSKSFKMGRFLYLNDIKNMIHH